MILPLIASSGRHILNNEFLRSRFVPQKLITKWKMSNFSCCRHSKAISPGFCLFSRPIKAGYKNCITMIRHLSPTAVSVSCCHAAVNAIKPKWRSEVKSSNLFLIQIARVFLRFSRGSHRLALGRIKSFLISELASVALGV